MDQVKIVSGPSREEMFDSLRLFKERRRVEFVLDDSRNSQFSTFCSIVSIQAEDGSGQSWNLDGYAEDGLRFQAYYRTDKRTGIWRPKTN